MPIKPTSVLTLNTHHTGPSYSKEEWQTILGDSFTNPNALLSYLGLKSTQHEKGHQLFRTRVPRPFADKMQRLNPKDPLLLQVLPVDIETQWQPGFVKDPLIEQQKSHDGLLHKYASRVLLIFRTACAVNCRYCFRRHFPYSENTLTEQNIAKAINYIKQDPAINEVILSGGDPLMAKDTAIISLIERLQDIPQLQRLRIHTRLPVVIPERITQSLCTALQNSRLKTIMVLHINHSNEIDEHFQKHIKHLKEAGVTLLNQAVLLRDVNDTSKSLIKLSEALFDSDIMPYYLFLLDKVEGAAHFEIPEQKAKTLMREISTQLPGFLVPKLAKETGGEPYKTVISY